MKINNLVLIIILISFSSIFSQEKPKLLRDTIDNAVDLSYFLTKKNGVLPIVIPITEPAVGFGAIGGGLYFIPKKDTKQPSDIVGLAGGITTNGTWFAGGGYVGFWKEDRIRYRGVAGYGEVTMDYYGVGNRPISMSMDAFLFLQQANFRLGKSDFFLGVKYQFSKITIPLFENSDILDPFDFDLINSGVALIAEYDNLNNFLSPTKGLRVHLSYDQNMEFLGSDRNWGKAVFFSHLYAPVNEKWIPALRLEALLATGDTPFYAKPFVSLRGVPMLRYQGDLVILAETEQLYNITSRWGILGFTGLGAAYKSIDNLKADELVWNAGGGVRYLIARALGLKMGADIARGPENWAFYVVIGTSWLK